MGEKWSLRLLGPPGLYCGAGEIHIQRRKAVGLLAYLALAGRAVSRDVVCGVLWPDQSSSSARRALRTTLSGLRDVLPQGSIESRQDTIELSDGSFGEIDVLTFERDARAFEDIVRRDEATVYESWLIRAQGLVDLVRGPFLEGFSLPSCSEFDDWQFMTSERLRSRQISLLWTIVRTAVDADDQTRALDAARRLLALDPTDDSVHQELMILLAEKGERPAALAQLRSFERIAERYGETETSAAVHELADLIAGRDGLPSATRREQRVPPGWSPTAADEGEVRRTDEVPVRRVVTALLVTGDAASSNDRRAIVAGCTAAAVLHDGTLLERNDCCALGFGVGNTHDDDPERALLAARGVFGYLRAAGMEARCLISTALVDGNALEDWLASVERVLPRVRPGVIALCARSRRAVDERWRTVALVDPGEHEGISDEPTLYALDEQSSRRDAGGEEIPYVGRRRELHDVLRVCNEAKTVPGWIGFVAGEAGIGKTRLVHESRRTSEEESSPDAPLYWYVCQSEESLQGRCLAALRGLAEPMVEEIAGRSEMNEESVRRCVETLVSYERLLPADIVPTIGVLSRLVRPDRFTAVPGDTRSTEAESFEREAQRAVGALVSHVASLHPVIVVFEDVHLADSGSIGVLVQLARLTEYNRFSLIVTYRPADLSSLRSLPDSIAAHAIGRHAHIVLHQLSPRESAQIYASVMTDWPATSRHDPDLLRRAEGNPLYLLELCRLLRFEGSRAPRVPLTLVRIVQRRTDRLSADARLVLHAASVLGGRASLRMLSAMITELQGPPNVRQLVDLLVAQELLVVSFPGEERELEFRHELIRDAVYAQISDARLKTFHAAAVCAAESGRRHEETVDAEFLAYHADQAGDARKAVRYLSLAGHDARSSHDVPRAIDRYVRAVEHLTRGEAESNGLEEDRDLHLAHAQVLHEQLRFAEASTAYARAFACQGRGLTATGPHPEGFSEVLRIGHGKYPLAVDWATDSTPPNGLFQRPLTRGLTRMRVDGIIVPDAAESWTMAPDGRLYTFVIRDDAFWSDGEPLVAEDFRHGFVRGLISNLRLAGRMQIPVTGQEEFAATGDEAVLGVQVTGPKLLDLRLDRTFGFLFQVISDLGKGAVPVHRIERLGRAWSVPGNCVYAGPFVLDHLDERYGAVLARNPRHRVLADQCGTISELRYLPFERDALIAAFLKMRVDVVPVPYVSAKAVMTGVSRFLKSGPDFSMGLIVFYTARDAVAWPAVRRALALAIDRRELVRACFGGAHYPALGGVIPPSVPGHSPRIGLKFDPEAARRSLPESERERLRREPLRLLASVAHQEVVEFVVESWRSVLGIVPDATVLPFREFLDEVTKSGYDAVVGATTGALHPEPYVRGFVFSRGLLTPISPLSTPEEIGWANEAPELEERLNRFRELDRRVTRSAARVPLYYHNSYTLVRPWVSSLRLQPFGYATFEDGRVLPHHDEET